MKKILQTLLVIPICIIFCSFDANINPLPTMMGSRALNSANIDHPKTNTAIQLSAKKTEHAAVLKWTSKKNLKISRYQIQHSAGGDHFITIGEVKVDDLKGTPNFSFTDRKPVSGINYYRLRGLESDGQMAESEVRVVVFDPATIRVSQNAAGSKLIVIVDSTADNAPLRILDVNGKEVIKTRLKNNQQEVNISMLRPGTYIAEAQTLTLPVRMKFRKK